MKYLAHHSVQHTAGVSTTAYIVLALAIVLLLSMVFFARSRK